MVSDDDDDDNANQRERIKVREGGVRLLTMMWF